MGAKQHAGNGISEVGAGKAKSSGKKEVILTLTNLKDEAP